ncbi:hypothetical protein EVAR_20320_1, partial [Eumeta japonica]
ETIKVFPKAVDKSRPLIIHDFHETEMNGGDGNAADAAGNALRSLRTRRPFAARPAADVRRSHEATRPEAA